MTATPRPTLTIVTVVRDDDTGLEQTRASLAANLGEFTSEDLTELQWVVIDSSDPPLSAPELHLITQSSFWQPPEGIYEAMNMGLDEAHGSWVYFLNAGDTLSDAKALKTLLTGLHTTSAPWGFARVVFRNARGQVLEEPPWDYQSHRDRLFASGRFPPHQGTIVSTDLLRSLGGFDVTYRVVADYHAAIRLSTIADPEIWTWPLAEFEQGGSSSTNWQQAHREMHRARKEVFQPTGLRAIVEAWRTTTTRWRHAASVALASIRG